MASTFSFGFAGDDINTDDEDSTILNTPTASEQGVSSTSIPQLVPAETHDIDEWLMNLPSQISYNKVVLNGDDTGPQRVLLARREMFDVRAQLMAEDNINEETGELIANLAVGDLKPNFYEGGFKTWECALDLAKLLAAEFPRIMAGSVELAGERTSEVTTHIIELGAGTAMPSLCILARLLALPASESIQRRTHFTFADYNSTVLRLVTLPNILLTWNANAASGDLEPAGTNGGSSSHKQQVWEGDGGTELEITPELLEQFKRDLSQSGISISFISGAWSFAFVDLAMSIAGTQGGTGLRTLILASETIYSPSALGAFSETVLELLHRSCSCGRSSTAYIAAKKVYFGVGGGIDEFLSVLKNMAQGEVAVREKLDVRSEGVGRIVLELELSKND